MSNAADRLTQWILMRSAEEPLKIQISLLKDTAVTVGGSKALGELNKIIGELESADRRCRQLRLDLGDAAQPSTPNDPL